MNDPIPAMSRKFGISPMDCYLLLVVPRFAIGAAGGGTTWHHQTVAADLRASIAEDDSDQVATEDLIDRLYRINLTHVGWFVTSVRSMRPEGEIFTRPRTG